MENSSPKPIGPTEAEIKEKKAIKLALMAPSFRNPTRFLLKNAFEEMDKNSSLTDLSPYGIYCYLQDNLKGWHEWLPETIWAHISPDIDDITKSKIRAIQTVITTPDIQFDTQGFNAIVTAFNDELPDWETLDPLPCHEIVYGIQQIKKINPKFETWPAVENFILACMHEESIVWLPWIAMDINRLVPYDTSSIKVAWEKVKAHDVDGIDITNPLHVQIQRLKDIQEYLSSKEK